jgi:hypothetical protein
MGRSHSCCFPFTRAAITSVRPSGEMAKLWTVLFSGAEMVARTVVRPHPTPPNQTAAVKERQ